MDVGAEIIFIVKTNTKGLYKDNIENLTKYFLGGSYLVLKRKYVVPGDMPLISIGYKYNTWTVIYFIDTEDVGRKSYHITYLYK